MQTPTSEILQRMRDVPALNGRTLTDDELVEFYRVITDAEYARQRRLERARDVAADFSSGQKQFNVLVTFIEELESQALLR